MINSEIQNKGIVRVVPHAGRFFKACLLFALCGADLLRLIMKDF